MHASRDSAPQISIWYFTAATLVFAASVLVFGDADPWARVGLIAVGVALIAVGCVHLVREWTRRPGTRAPEPPNDP